MILLLCSDAVLALDVNPNSHQSSPQQVVNQVSMDDVARLIRQKKQWHILGAQPNHRGSVTSYRFKVISKTGKVKIINIDPRRPNLRQLEQ